MNTVDELTKTCEMWRKECETLRKQLEVAKEALKRFANMAYGYYENIPDVLAAKDALAEIEKIGKGGVNG